MIYNRIGMCDRIVCNSIIMESNNANETAAFPIEKSEYYHFYLMEKNEIEKHKWFVSEKLGRDCGYSYAQWQWVMNYRDAWINGLRESGFFNRPHHGVDNL